MRRLRWLRLPSCSRCRGSGSRGPCRAAPPSAETPGAGARRDRAGRPRRESDASRHRVSATGPTSRSISGSMAPSSVHAPNRSISRRAQSLRDRPAGGEVLEAVRRDGVITRFDRRRGDFLAFDRDRTIRTFFRPNDGEAYLRPATRSVGGAYHDATDSGPDDPVRDYLRRSGAPYSVVAQGLRGLVENWERVVDQVLERLPRSPWTTT